MYLRKYLIKQKKKIKQINKSMGQGCCKETESNILAKQLKPKETSPICKTAKKWKWKNVKKTKGSAKDRTHDLGLTSTLPFHMGGYTSVDLCETKTT